MHAGHIGYGVSDQRILLPFGSFLLVFDWIRGRRRRKLIRGYIFGIKGRGVIALENRLDCKSQVRIRHSLPDEAVNSYFEI